MKVTFSDGALTKYMEETPSATRVKLDDSDLCATDCYIVWACDERKWVGTEDGQLSVDTHSAGAFSQDDAIHYCTYYIAKTGIVNFIPVYVEDLYHMFNAFFHKNGGSF